MASWCEDVPVRGRHSTRSQIEQENLAWFKAGLQPGKNHACLSTILPLSNSPAAHLRVTRKAVLLNHAENLKPLSVRTPSNEL